MNRTYILRFFALALPAAAILSLASCTEDPPTQPPAQQPDTTSHSFVWHTDTLGDWLSRVNDVFCLSENEAWAVGLFYKLDSAGKAIDSLTSNAAHWDGVKWTLIRVAPIAQSTGRPTFGENYTVFALSPNDLWFGPPQHWDGLEWKSYNVNQISSGKTRKIWGKNPDAMYFVGENGSLMYWDGLRFYQMGYATTAANLDVWGWEDTVYVAVTDYDKESGVPGYMIKLVNGRVQGRERIYGGNMLTVWGMNGTWYGGGCTSGYAYRKTGGEWESIKLPIRPCIEDIRGTALNNIFLLTEERYVIHFNGKSMEIILPRDPEATLTDGMSVAGKLVLIGDTKNGRALVYRGYQQ